MFNVDLPLVYLMPVTGFLYSIEGRSDMPQTQHWICKTCGTQFGASETAPERCPICEDERQYVGINGQEWTTLAALQKTHHTELRALERDLTGIGASPSFAIGQRALLVQTGQGNVLWDCISLIDGAARTLVSALGGLAGVAISHPHYYSSMVEWAHAFDAPVYLHAADREWVMRADPSIVFWEGETRSLPGGLTLIRCGGHFPGGTVLHWPDGAGGGGALLGGDIVNVASDRRHVSFMYSFPNQIPLPASAVRRAAAAVEPYPFERIYGAWWDRVIAQDGKAAVRRSVDRYIAAITDPPG
jgi:glyoxylase-like metal-dependent hydrolase (beta-lactamase superfamily II)